MDEFLYGDFISRNFQNGSIRSPANIFPKNHDVTTKLSKASTLGLWKCAQSIQGIDKHVLRKTNKL